MKVLVVATNYVLLLHLLMERKWKETYFIFWSGFSDSVINRIREYNIAHYKGLNINRKKNFIYRHTIFLLEKLRYMFQLYKLRKNSLEVYGQDHIPEALGFIDGEFKVIEDGIANYDGYDIVKSRSEKNNNASMINGKKYIPLGYDDIIKKIYLTGLRDIPSEIYGKVEFLDIQELWDSKTSKEKDEILKIFGVDFQLMKNLEGKTEYLLTQPFSEVGYITESEKINIYKKILKNYDERKIIIKKHPYEKTNYKNIFPKCYIMDCDVPFELIGLLGIEISRIITITSSAALGKFNNVAIDFYGISVDSKLKKACNDKGIYI